jgi:hypothetical protein
MPTHAEDARFLRQWERLTRAQQEQFKVAVARFVADLRTGDIRPGLRVKGYQREEGVFELTWAPDGRALFRYGDAVRPGEVHIIWLSIGTHAILDEP